MKRRPNILFLMADQLAAPVLPLYGHKLVKTPNLERLAAQGTVFENSYCNSPICASSRFSMMSGQLPTQIGAYDNAAEFPASIPTFAHYLRELGYATCLSGKMHFVGPDQLHGFEDRVTTDIYPSDFGWTPDWTQGKYPYAPSQMSMRGVVEAGLCTRSLQIDYDEDVANQAIQRLYDHARGKSEKPFLLVSSFTHPHNPFTTTRRFWDLYRHDDIDMPAVPFIPFEARDAWSKRYYYLIRQDEHRVTDEMVRTARHAYYGMTSYVDHQVGRILEVLNETGLAENTVVVFTADHGDMLGERGMWYKFNPFEWSVRVPLVIKAPGAPGGRRAHPNVSLVDLLPTLLDLATDGQAPELADRIDGTSLANEIHGASSALPDEALVEFAAEGVSAPAFILRKGRFKYVYCETDPGMMFDLEGDPNELRNIAQDPAHGARAEAMKKEIVERCRPQQVREQVLASQRRRLFVQRALARGRPAPWDFQVIQDASRQYVRSMNNPDTTATKSKARLPYVTPAPPDFPRAE